MYFLTISSELFTAVVTFLSKYLSKAKDRKLTEYVLIGTLISFMLAIIAGLGYVYFSALI